MSIVGGGVWLSVLDDELSEPEVVLSVVFVFELSVVEVLHSDSDLIFVTNLISSLPYATLWMIELTVVSVTPPLYVKLNWFPPPK